jgi:hypothetical protein
MQKHFKTSPLKTLDMDHSETFLMVNCIKYTSLMAHIEEILQQ